MSEIFDPTNNEDHDDMDTDQFKNFNVDLQPQIKNQIIKIIRHNISQANGNHELIELNESNLSNLSDELIILESDGTSERSKANADVALVNDVHWLFKQQDKLIDLDRTFIINNIENLTKLFENGRLANVIENLKRLKISFYFVKVNLDFLANFTSLEQLDIYFIQSLSKNHELKLEKLKTLQIQHGKMERTIKIIQSNKLIKLENLYCDDLKLFEFNEEIKNSIKYLYLSASDSSDSSDDAYKAINEFNNLEEIVICDKKILKLFQISKFHRLKKLTYALDDSNFFYLKSKDSKAKVKDQLKESKDILKDYFFSKNNALVNENGEEIEIYYLGIKINNERKSPHHFEIILDELMENAEDGDLIQDSNDFDESTKFNFFDRIDYGHLIAIYDHHNELLAKFPNIIIVMMHQPVSDPDLFSQFLIACPNLIGIDFFNTYLDQNFYDEKLTKKKLLTEINIQYGDEDEEASANFKFILKFQLLELFETNQQLGRDFLIELEKLKLLKRIFFMINDLKVRIYKYKRKDNEISYLLILKIGSKVVREKVCSDSVCEKIDQDSIMIE